MSLRDRAGPWTLEDLAELGDDGPLHELYVRLGTDARRPDVAVLRGDAPVTRHQLGVEAQHVWC